MRAASYDSQSAREQVERQQREAELERLVDQDVRLLARYQQHVKTWHIELRQARTAPDARTAERAHAKAAAELALARALRPLFTADVGSLGEQEDVEYDRNFVLEELKATDQRLNELRSSESPYLSRQYEGRAVDLIGIATLAIASLLPLTLAQFSRRPRLRWTLTTVGALLLLIAPGMLIAIELRA